ncbi:MAG: serine protease, partial [Sphaerospermopsis kisseleviana]
PAEEPESSLLPDAGQVSDHHVKQTAKFITVKILSNGFLGTGTLINKQGKVYTVITNDHVLNAADPPYQIQTFDGRIYAAQVSQVVKFGDDDLGLLQFSSEQVYQVASVGNSSVLNVGDEVFVTGFTSESKEIIFTKGNVSLFLDKPLEGGYQMGYTNDIDKGMSGGPVLNFQGELVGINGLHKNPVWEAPDLYADGSQPCKPVQDMIIRSSWAIPIETVARLAPKFVQIKPPQLLLSLESESIIIFSISII